jgi:peptidoglycan/xylan/chitin deacetylase (PgdA/CDA1 family)
MSTSLPVLTLHAIEDGSSTISFPPRLFRHGMARLHERGFRTLPLLDVVGDLRRRQPLPSQSLVITFDDGYRSVYEEAFPVLQEHRMSATIFLAVGKPGPARFPWQRLPSLEGRSMLSWAEIREMHRWGIAMGAHTLTHQDLTRLPVQRAEAEMRDSKATIEDALGAPVECFAYPHGRHDAPSRALARRYFFCACGDRLGLLRPGSDPYALERVETYYLTTARLFDLVPTRWLPWYLRVRSLPRALRRAVADAVR